jgi:hypothetical protein
LEEEVAAPVWKIENTAVGIRRSDHATPPIRKNLALTSPTSGGRSVGIVRSRTKVTELFIVIVFQHLPELMLHFVFCLDATSLINILILNQKFIIARLLIPHSINI